VLAAAARSREQHSDSCIHMFRILKWSWKLRRLNLACRFPCNASTDTPDDAASSGVNIIMF